jgi:peptidoglycan LD-endopeptidase LytH
MQPRGTPILAVTDGIVVKLYYSKAGGNTIYEFDNAKRFCFYYAHLDNYAAGLREGSHIDRGNVIGYVGSTGNASTPHLHFAIYELDSTRAWWKGVPLDPFPVLTIAADKFGSQR